MILADMPTGIDVACVYICNPSVFNILDRVRVRCGAERVGLNRRSGAGLSITGP